jgi:uncharacterized RDD family membrane protein YckC
VLLLSPIRQHQQNFRIGLKHSGLSVSLTEEPFLLWVAISLLYRFVAELMTAQTIGKRMMGLKVITVNGRPLGLEPVLLRTLGRIVDVLPVFYLIGWIAMRGRHQPPQRLGDRLAGTTVGAGLPALTVTPASA